MAERLAECALLITAHPDDEAMFWAPTILALLQQGMRVALLCLSTGNADGLGQLRAQELHRACSLLGIQRQDITLVDDPRLQDGMQQRWPEDVVAEHVSKAVQLLQPSRVYTFDAGGVSGHPNHLAVCAGVMRWRAAAPSSSSAASLPQLWQLETVGLLRKYAAILDAPMAWSTMALRWWQRGRAQAACHLCWQPRQAQHALLAHTSQMVWYRRLWLLLSRYMYVNTLVRCL